MRLHMFREALAVLRAVVAAVPVAHKRFLATHVSARVLREADFIRGSKLAAAPVAHKRLLFSSVRSLVPFEQLGFRGAVIAVGPRAHHQDVAHRVDADVPLQVGAVGGPVPGGPPLQSLTTWVSLRLRACLRKERPRRPPIATCQARTLWPRKRGGNCDE